MDDIAIKTNDHYSKYKDSSLIINLSIIYISNNHSFSCKMKASLRLFNDFDQNLNLS